jgi:HEAT repeat protein
MIIEDENRDSVKDLLDLASVFLRDQGNNGDLEAILEYIKIEIKYALTQENFQLAYKTLKLLHKMRLESITESPWATSMFNSFIISISDPEYLKVFSKILPTFDKIDLNRFTLIKQFFLMLHSNVILTLGPLLSQIRSSTIHQQLLGIIELLAKRNLQTLEKMLSSTDEHMVRNLVCIVGRMKGDRAKQILLKMIHNPSEKVREQAFKYLLARHTLPSEVVFPFIEDSSKNIRQLIFDYLIKTKPELGETLLIDYIQAKAHLLNDNQQIIDCYKALGKCGSSKSIPFLQHVLFKRQWLPDLRGSIHRQGAVIALIGIETSETKKILQKASRSFFPNVRVAYKRGIEAIH